MFDRDKHYMKQAIKIGQQGLFNVHPNPSVGCIIVSEENKIVAQGAHIKYGQFHAETNAIKSILSPQSLQNSTIYLTLEPCAHIGNQPACVEQLVQLDIKRIVIAMIDPDPKTMGKSIKILKVKGIDVSIGCMAHKAFELCPGFIKRQTYGLPWIRLKVAASIDGKMCFSDRSYQRLTGEKSRIHSHFWRARSSCILTGIGTISADNPLMNIRYDYSVDNQPLLAILDTNLNISTSAACLTLKRRVCIFHCCHDSKKINEIIKNPQITLIKVEKNQENKLNIKECLYHLAQTYSINEVLVEAGPQITRSFLQQDLYDDFLLYTAPFIMGAEHISFSPLLSITHTHEQSRLILQQYKKLDHDTFTLYRKESSLAKNFLQKTNSKIYQDDKNESA